MDEKKVKAVLEWPQPQTVKELQHFSRFCKPLQAIHQRFQQDRAPLTAMTKCHSARLISSPESRQAFDELKLSSLSHPCSDIQIQSVNSLLRSTPLTQGKAQYCPNVTVHQLRCTRVPFFSRQTHSHGTELRSRQP